MDTTQISKRIAYVLRHNPSSIGIILDENGWADVTEFLQGMKIDMKTLQHIVDTDNKKRYTFNDDKTKIRAAQGHSIEVDLGLKPTKPPEILYHGTAQRFWHPISRYGLIKGQRQYVHLSKDIETAKKVGIRHGQPLVLEIQSGKMAEEGYDFFLSENEIWLTDHVPVSFIKVAPQEGNGSVL